VQSVKTSLAVFTKDGIQDNQETSMSAQLDQVLAQAANDPDVMETQEWLDALEAVIETEGPDRAHYLVERMIDLARRRGAQVPFSPTTAYVNTIPADMGERCPGNLEYEERLRSWMRWNAMAMVVKANRVDGDLGGHISSFASLANMLGIGFNHFWHAPTEDHGGDLLYIQGHSSPGVYARAFLEGRSERRTTDQLPSRSRRQRFVILSASETDAGILAVPDRIDGSRPIDGDLSGSLPQVSAST
jgi:pyruvate dehydrogenase complex dehydrogenase (E1) component